MRLESFSSTLRSAEITQNAQTSTPEPHGPSEAWSSKTGRRRGKAECPTRGASVVLERQPLHTSGVFRRSSHRSSYTIVEHGPGATAEVTTADISRRRAGPRFVRSAAIEAFWQAPTVFPFRSYFHQHDCSDRIHPCTASSTCLNSLARTARSPRRDRGRARRVSRLPGFGTATSADTKHEVSMDYRRGWRWQPDSSACTQRALG